jgi:maltooligosyltrehalose trehalohydrolase
MGQEFAASTPFQYFTDHERDLGALITAGRRREFGAFPAFAAHPDAIPDPQDPATFDRSKLRHEERDASRGVYRLYRDLLAIRRDDPTIARQDRFALRTAALGPQALALLFEVRGARRLLVVNVGGVLECTVPFRLGRARWRAVFNSDANAYGGSGASARLIRGRLSIPGEMAVLFAPTERGGTTPAP